MLQPYYVEDKGQLDALEEFAPKIREILRRFRDERQLKSIALKVGVNAARLTEMITTDGQGNYGYLMYMRPDDYDLAASTLEI